MAIVLSFLTGFAVASIISTMAITIAMVKFIKKLEVKRYDIPTDNNTGNSTQGDK